MLHVSMRDLKFYSMKIELMNVAFYFKMAMTQFSARAVQPQLLALWHWPQM